MPRNNAQGKGQREGGEGTSVESVATGAWTPWLACYEGGGGAVACREAEQQEEAAMPQALSPGRCGLSNRGSWRGTKTSMWPKCPPLHPGRGPMVLETLGCHAPGGFVGALTSCR